jgi:hypothetical protein
MAAKEPNTSSVSKQRTNDDVSGKLDLLLTSVSELKENQENMKRMFESKLDKLKSDLITNVDTKIRALRDELSIDIGKETTRTDQMLITIQTLQSRVDAAEQAGGAFHNGNVYDVTMQTSGSHDTPVNQGNPLDNQDITIVAFGIPETENEDLIHKAMDIINSLGEGVSTVANVTAAVRIPNRFDSRPGIVKISFGSIQEKVAVLRNKWKLKAVEEYKRVFLKSSKSRVERLIERNARAVVRNLPQGNSLRVDANGIITSRRQHTQQHQQHQQQHSH